MRDNSYLCLAFHGGLKRHPNPHTKHFSLVLVYGNANVLKHNFQTFYHLMTEHSFTKYGSENYFLRFSVASLDRVKSQRFRIAKFNIQISIYEVLTRRAIFTPVFHLNIFCIKFIEIFCLYKLFCSLYHGWLRVQNT